MNAKLELVRNWLIKAQHDLAAVRKLAEGPDPYLAEVAVQLTPYATEFRYPGGLLAPPADEFEQALEAATGLYSFVLSLLPAEVQP